MPKVYNRVKVVTATAGAGAVSLGAAVAGYQTWAAAGAVNNEIVHYLIEDGSAWEFGYGTYLVSSLQRTTIPESSNADAAINLTGAGVVSCVPFAESLRGQHAIWNPAVSMQPRVTNGPAIGSIEIASNRLNMPSLDFDATTAEFAQFHIWLPPSWNAGTVIFQPLWSHAATATNFNVSWKLQGMALKDADAFSTPFGTAVEVADTGGTTDRLFIGPESAAVTLNQVAADASNRLGIFQIQRDPASVSDNLGIDARLHGVWLYYTTNTPVDD